MCVCVYVRVHASVRVQGASTSGRAATRDTHRPPLSTTATHLLLLLRRFQGAQRGIGIALVLAALGALGVESGLELLHLKAWMHEMRMVEQQEQEQEQGQGQGQYLLCQF